MVAAPPVSASAGAVLATTLSPEQLRAIATAQESETVRARNRRGLTAADVEELAEMLASGRRPTVGWWRRHREAAA